MVCCPKSFWCCCPYWHLPCRTSVCECMRMCVCVLVLALCLHCGTLRLEAIFHVKVWLCVYLGGYVRLFICMYECVYMHAYMCGCVFVCVIVTHGIAPQVHKCAFKYQCMYICVFVLYLRLLSRKHIHNIHMPNS